MYAGTGLRSASKLNTVRVTRATIFSSASVWGIDAAADEDDCVWWLGEGLCGSAVTFRRLKSSPGAAPDILRRDPPPARGLENLYGAGMAHDDAS